MSIPNERDPNKYLFAGAKRLMTVDLTDDLDGDTLTGTATWAVSGAGITTSSPTNSTTAVSVWITAGTTVGVYSASFTVSTTAGAVMSERLLVHVQAVTP